MKCPTCRTENKPDAKFCGICGISLSETNSSVAAQQPRVGFRDAVFYGFKGTLNFKGRATRAEFWWWLLFYPLALLIIYFVRIVISQLLPIDGGNGSLVLLGQFLNLILTLLYFVVLIVGEVAAITVSARRLHDIDKSGWWQLLWLVPVIGWIILIIHGIRQGNNGNNQHGPDPRTTPRA